MINDFDADDLRIIALLAAGMNMSTIGAKLGITSQRISQRIQRMEKICKTQLIYRTGGLRLTPAGLKLHAHAKRVEDSTKTFKADLAELASDHGQLRIIAISSLLIDDLPDVLDKVAKEYPHLRITLDEGAADKILKSVTDGTSDIGLIGMLRQIDGLAFAPYKRERICLLMNESHPLAERENLYFKEASSYPFIGMAETNLMSNIMNLAELRARVFVTRSIKVSSLEIAAQMACKSEFGICLTLESVASRHARANNGKLVLLSDAWASIEMTTCTREIATRSPATTYFISELKQRFKS